MITALAEFIDILYTKCATEIDKSVCWRISLRQADPELPAAGPLVQLHGHRQQLPGTLAIGIGDFHTIDIKFAAVEQGARVGAEELAIVADYYIRKLKVALDAN